MGTKPRRVQGAFGDLGGLMPYTVGDVDKHKKGLSDKEKGYGR